MRLPTRHIYRAFKELDTYSDEQCRRFITAAKGGIRRRAFAGSIILLVAIILTPLSIALVAWLTRSFFAGSRTLDISHPNVTWYGWLLNILLAIGGISIAPLVAYLIRDRLLIRRIRYVLRTRGTCISCRYTLVGLFVGLDLLVTCPECGATTLVDPALGELATDESGRARFKPAEPAPRRRRLLTEARARRLKRAAPWIAAAVIGFPIILAGAYEGFIRWQAGVARRERPAHDALAVLVESRQPKGSYPSDANAIDLLSQVLQRKQDIDEEVWGSESAWNAGAPPQQQIYPEYAAIYSSLDEVYGSMAISEDLRDEYARSSALASAMMTSLEESDLFDLLDAMVDAPRSDRQFHWTANAPLMNVNMSLSGETRQLAQILAARMHLARVGGDGERYASTLRSGLALATLLMDQPLLVDYFFGVAIESLVISELREDLVNRSIPAEWLPALHEILAHHIAGVTHDHWIEGTRIVTRDAIAWTFSDPGRVRFGRWSPAIRALGYDPNPLGTYRRNITVADRQLDEMAAWQTQPVSERASPDTSSDELLLLADQFAYARHMITIDGQSRLLSSGTLCMIALERYRLAQGDYPMSLEALVPGFLPSVPIDPWVDTPMGYVRIDPAADSLGRSYLLYSTGADFKDNRGLQNPTVKNPYSILSLPAQPVGDGYDFIINDTR